MNRIWRLVCVLALVAIPASGSSLGGGVGFMDTSDVGDDNGFGFKFSLDAGSHWNIDLRGGFFDSYQLVQGERQLDFEATAIDVGLSYEFDTGSKVRPYVGGGLNYTNYKVESFNFVEGEPEAARIKDEPGIYVVVGLEIPVSGRIAFYGEGLYRQSKPTVQGDGIGRFRGDRGRLRRSRRQPRHRLHLVVDTSAAAAAPSARALLIRGRVWSTVDGERGERTSRRRLRREPARSRLRDDGHGGLGPSRRARRRYALLL